MAEIKLKENWGINSNKEKTHTEVAIEASKGYMASMAT